MPWLRAGIEGSVHAMRELYDEHHVDGWGVILVDVKNAFNYLNRSAALWNVTVQQWPRWSHFLFNTYRGYASLLLQGSSEVIPSKEGVAQGDPLSMLMYAVALMPLIKHLTDQGKWIQNWYADDSACTAKLSNLKVWFQKLCELGPDYGYHPEPKKTVLFVRALFGELGVKIVRGHRFLGGFIGEEEDVHSFILEKVKTWTSGVGVLAEAAELHPQAAIAALSKSQQFQWSYLQRVVPNCESCFEILRNAAVSSFANSRKYTAHIVDAIKCNSSFSVFNHIDHLLKLHRELNHDIIIQYQNLLNSVLQAFDDNKKRAIQRGIDGKPSARLTVIPIAYHHFDQSATEFRDSLALRYH